MDFVFGDLLVLIFLLGLSATVSGTDQVTRRSDRVVFRGELTAMTPSLLTIRLQNGQTQEIPVPDVLIVRFDMEPPALSQAQSSERSGALDVALEKYRLIQAEYGSTLESSASYLKRSKATPLRCRNFSH
jgi:hypothetical protein